jgi:hypothetical protein
VTRAVVAFLCVALLVLDVGCANGRDGESDLEYVGAFIRTRAENADFSEPPRALVAYVEQAVIDDAAIVIVGRVVGGEDGADFTADARPAASGAAAAWRTIHLRVDVSEALDVEPAPRTVIVGVVVDPDMDTERIVSGLRALGPAVFFLHKSAVFAYDPAIYAVGREASLIATIDSEQDALDLPFVPSATAARMLAGSSTIARLRQAARDATKRSE